MRFATILRTRKQEPGLRVYGPMDATGGYGQFVAAITNGLAARGYRVHARPSNPERILASGIDDLISQGGDRDLVIHPPPSLASMIRDGVQTVVMTMWETTNLREEWVAALNRAACVIVPNEWNACCFSAAGVKVPIRVVGLGCDPAFYHPSGPEARRGTLFRVGVAGRWSSGQERKGLREAVEVFRSAFTPGDTSVELQVKCFPECPVDAGGDPRIRIIRDTLDDRALGDWYRSLGVFLSMSRAEGWGLHQQQALMCGVPLISTLFGGVAHFFDPACGYQIDHTLQPATGYYEGLGLWAEPSRESAIGRLRQAKREWEDGSGIAWWNAVRDWNRFTESRMVGGVESVCREFSVLP